MIFYDSVGYSPVHTAETLDNLLIFKRLFFTVLRLCCKFDFCPIPFPLLRNKEKYPQTKEFSLNLSLKRKIAWTISVKYTI